MPADKTHIRRQLQKDILALQGFKNLQGNNVAMGLGPIELAFPNACFPVAGIHEFISMEPEAVAATSGFIAGLMAMLKKDKRPCVWISTSRKLFPPALKIFGIEPDQIIFIDLQKEKDCPWVMEEVLKCNGIAVVVAEMPEISFTTSRRLQLATEQSQVTGFIMRNHPRNLNANACMSRWRITPLPTELEESMPGIGFPRWKVELLKIRNGKPGEWTIEWSGGRFRPLNPLPVPMPQEEKRKAG